MALTKDEPRRFETSSFTAAIASTAIYQGACVGTVRASGQAAGGAFASATHRFAGFATTRAAIGERVTIDAKGRVILTVAGTSAASVNAVAYASDDNTFNVSGSGIAIGRISWVQDDGKCVVDFDAGIEAAAPGIATDGAGNTVLRVAGGGTYAALPVVAPDLVEANVNLRTDTLTNLLAEAGGVSEIGYDPATKTVVLFNGVAAQATASGRNRVIASACAKVTDVTTPGVATTYVAIPWRLDAIAYEDGAIFTVAAPEKLAVPANATGVRIRGAFDFSAGIGLTRQFRIEGSSDGTNWASLGPLCVFPSDGTNIAYGAIDIFAPLSGGETHVRLAATNSGPVALTVGGLANNAYITVDFLAL